VLPVLFQLCCCCVWGLRHAEQWARTLFSAIMTEILSEGILYAAVFAVSTTISVAIVSSGSLCCEMVLLLRLLYLDIN